jgi:ABC-type Na+ efflux pump permease subunit
MAKTQRISNNALGVIIGLVLSVWWIFMGLVMDFSFESFNDLSHIVTLAGYRHAVMPIAALILIPICAKGYRWSFLAAMILGALTFVLSSITVVNLLVSTPPDFQQTLMGPLVWLIFQVIIVVFAYRALKQTAG